MEGSKSIFKDHRRNVYILSVILLISVIISSFIEYKQRKGAVFLMKSTDINKYLTVIMGIVSIYFTRNVPSPDRKRGTLKYVIVACGILDLANIFSE